MNRPNRPWPGKDRPTASTPRSYGQNTSTPRSYGQNTSTPRPYGQNTAPPSHFQSPWAWLSLAQPHPLIWKKTVKMTSQGIRSGDLVSVYGPDKELVGSGLYAPRSQHCLRMLRNDGEPFSKNWMKRHLSEAVKFRTETLKLDDVTNAYRVIHGEGDECPGLVVDRFDSVLAIEIFTEGWLALLPDMIPQLHALLGTTSAIVRADEKARQVEHFRMDATISGTLPNKITINENGLKFRVDVKYGHKTGFFCDQRDNRRALTEFTKGRSVLDVCSYTGGFAIAAMAKGEAKEVVAVDIDEAAIKGGKTNAGLNQTQIQWVRADGFAYMRQMQTNKKEYDVVVLDPPKFIPDRKTYDEGRRKYLDFNKLGLSLVKPGGIFMTSSCSGLLSSADLIEVVQSAERSADNKKRLRLIKMTGAGADHPVRLNCLESGYLKTAWFHVS
jgi:23S rRNA (cytosine1962-C5)-methyltransferase